MSVFKDGKEIKLREDFNAFAVVVLVNDQEVFRNAEYVTSATHLQKNYQLSDDEMMRVYRDYKADYDNRR